MSNLYGMTIGSNNYGSGTGIDVEALVTQSLANARKPESLMKDQQSTVEKKMDLIQKFQAALGSLEQVMAQLANSDGVLSDISATSSNTSALTATTDSTATAGTHTIVVQNLSSTSNAYSGSLNSANDAIGAGDLVLTVGSGAQQMISFDAGTTLSQAASKINQGNYGVTASVITDATGARLALTSKTAGAAGTLSISSAPANLTFIVNEGRNASATIDGVPISSATNSIPGVIQGVTINLAGATNGAEVKLTVGPDASTVSGTIQSFVSGYNGIINSINSQFSTGTPGILSGDSTLTMLQSDLMREMSLKVDGGGLQTLADIGITMNDDGTMALDQDKLNGVLTNNLDAVKSFFRNSDSTGFAQQYDKILKAETDSFTGPLQIDYNNLKKSDHELSERIDDLEAKLTEEQERLTKQFSEINVTLQRFPQQMAQVNSELQSLDNNSSNQ
jgi:flagellar hook-associated protein 2